MTLSDKIELAKRLASTAYCLVYGDWDHPLMQRAEAVVTHFKHEQELQHAREWLRNRTYNSITCTPRS